VELPWHGSANRREKYARDFADALARELQTGSADHEALLYAVADSLYVSPLGVPWEVAGRWHANAARSSVCAKGGEHHAEHSVRFIPLIAQLVIFLHYLLSYILPAKAVFDFVCATYRAAPAFSLCVVVQSPSQTRTCCSGSSYSFG
jgi:hypothetical protein